MIIEKEIDKLYRLAEMMLEPGNYKNWSSYFVENFGTKDDLENEKVIDFISRERDLIIGESSYSHAKKVTRIAASIKSKVN